jgi:hypothetical protein
MLLVAVIALLINGKPNLFMFELIEELFGEEKHGDKGGGICNRNLTEM